MERITRRSPAALLVVVAVGGGACGGRGDLLTRSRTGDVPPEGVDGGGERWQEAPSQASFPSCATTGGCLPDQQYCDEPGRFSATHDIVLDTTTNLSWQREIRAVRMTYSEAEVYCDALVLSGVTHFRVPTIAELNGLVLRPSTIFGCRPGFCCPAIDQSAFPGTPEDLFWSSTVAGVGLLYCLNFADGRHSNWKTDPDGACYVRCTGGASP